VFNLANPSDPTAAPDNSQDRLAGITSWGQGCGQPGEFGKYTNAVKIKDWIEFNTDAVRWTAYGGLTQKGGAVGQAGDVHCWPAELQTPKHNPDQLPAAPLITNHPLPLPNRPSTDRPT
jgi:hypothetical protein